MCFAHKLSNKLNYSGYLNNTTLWGIKKHTKNFLS